MPLHGSNEDNDHCALFSSQSSEKEAPNKSKQESNRTQEFMIPTPQSATAVPCYGVDLEDQRI